MAKTTLTQFPTGQTQYKINFDYLARPFVVVELVDSTKSNSIKRLVVENDYRFINVTTLVILAQTDGYDIVQIRRETSAEPLVGFIDGSVLTANNLNTSELQAIHIAEEGRDQTVELGKQYAELAKDFSDDAKDILDTINEMGSFGYTPVGSFEQSAYVSLPNQAVSYGSGTSITYWRWEGALPKDVPEGSSPSSTGGIGEGKWKDVTDTTLRGQLAGDNGYQLIPSIQIQQWRSVGDIRGWGAIEGEDATDAINAAIRSNTMLGWGVARKVRMKGHYRIDGKVFLPTDTQLIGDGCIISSLSDDWIIESGYRNSNGDIVSNLTGLTDEQALFEHRLKGVVIEGITFVGVSKGLKLRAFTQGCALRDLVFDSCGIAFDTRLSFYPEYSNILIRSVKAGYENSYAYQLRHQCNQVSFHKVTISERKYGELIDDDVVPTVMPAIGLNCQHINHTDCTYEGVEVGVSAKIKTFGYTNTGIYAEVVTGTLFEFNNVEHRDVTITPKWFAGVEKMGYFAFLKGDNKITQCMQYDYQPPRRSAIQFVKSTATVLAADGLADYNPTSTDDRGITWDTESLIHMPYYRLDHTDIPVSSSAVNLASQPYVISGMFRSKADVVIGVTSHRWDAVSNSLLLATDLYWSEANCILVGITLSQKSNPSGTVYNSSTILFNGFNLLVAGATVTYFNDGGLTGIRITNPTGGSAAPWLAAGDYTIQGCVRLI